MRGPGMRDLGTFTTNATGLFSKMIPGSCILDHCIYSAFPRGEDVSEGLLILAQRARRFNRLVLPFAKEEVSGSLSAAEPHGLPLPLSGERAESGWSAYCQHAACK